MYTGVKFTLWGGSHGKILWETLEAGITIHQRFCGGAYDGHQVVQA
jgi:hypothetical protein